MTRGDPTEVNGGRAVYSRPKECDAEIATLGLTETSTRALPTPMAQEVDPCPLDVLPTGGSVPILKDASDACSGQIMAIFIVATGWVAGRVSGLATYLLRLRM